MSDNRLIASKLYELRTFSDVSVEDVAEKLGITADEYAAYESGKREVPINVIYKFADIMDTEAVYITTGKLPAKSEVALVYDGKGVKTERYPGYSFTVLAGEFKGRTMNPMLVEIDENERPELVCHGGQEFNYVLEGALRVHIGDKDYYLRTGDSIFFNPSEPHAQMAMGGKARFLTVITE
ncbi:MAG: XRE family transcriptional regulator [Clostridiaceae bacterium]|jgi:transcriptional regulator with XRE-family HTH domain|nr:XRE family transcriptional regulator [Clostridiaceae bacterium]